MNIKYIIVDILISRRPVWLVDWIRDDLVTGANKGAAQLGVIIIHVKKPKKGLEAGIEAWGRRISLTDCCSTFRRDVSGFREMVDIYGL